MSEDTMKSLINLVPESIDNAAKNLTDKPTQNMGTTLADIWYLVFGGISQAAEKRKLKYSYALQEFEKELQEKVDQFERLSKREQQLIGDHLMSNHKEQWEIFLQCLQNALKRTIERIYIISLFGAEKEFCNIQDACDYSASDQKETAVKKNMFRGYEIIVKYSNGDKIEMRFQKKRDALTSLEKLV